MLKTLRIKFICFTMALVSVMLLAIFCTVYGFTAKNLEEDSLKMMYAMAIRPGIPGDPKQDPKVPYLVLQKSPLGIWAATGSNYYDLSDEAFLSELLTQVSGENRQSGVLTGYDMRFLQIGSRYVFMDISAERNTLKHLVNTCLCIGIVSLVLFFGISFLLSKWALKPVEAAWNQQRQFIADASHELKTPLAVILTNAELLDDSRYSQEEHRKFSQNILTMSCQMRHLVEGLLELARLDNVALPSQSLDFSQLTETALLPFEPVFFENGLCLESTVTPSLWVRGSDLHLKQVLEIFLDNALKYASGGTVTVSLTQSGTHALLQVENQGTPLSAEESKRIFQRFYRTYPRSGSYGLGLSIALRIIQQHGGKIWASPTENGNRFSVMLPLHPPAQK